MSEAMYMLKRLDENKKKEMQIAGLGGFGMQGMGD